MHRNHAHGSNRAATMRLKATTLIALGAIIVWGNGSAFAKSGRASASPRHHSAHWGSFYPGLHNGQPSHSSHWRAEEFPSARKHHRYVHERHRSFERNNRHGAGHDGGPDHSDASWPEESRQIHETPSRNSDPVMHFRETTTKSGTYLREWSTGSE